MSKNQKPSREIPTKPDPGRTIPEKDTEPSKENPCNPKEDK
jgi:hypothetical protein